MGCREARCAGLRRGLAVFVAAAATRSSKEAWPLAMTGCLAVGDAVPGPVPGLAGFRACNTRTTSASYFGASGSPAPLNRACPAARRVLGGRRVRPIRVRKVHRSSHDSFNPLQFLPARVGLLDNARHTRHRSYDLFLHVTAPVVTTHAKQTQAASSAVQLPLRLGITQTRISTVVIHSDPSARITAWIEVVACY